MATLDELVVRIKADTGQLERELRRTTGVVENSAGRMSTAFGALKSQLVALLPVVSAAAFIGFTKSAIDAAGALQDMADRTGASASFLSALEAQAIESGASLSDVGQAITFMNNSIGEAARGNQMMIDSFARLNINLEQLKYLSPEEQFYLITQRISELGTEFERTEAARNIFGRGAANLLPIIKQGGDAIRDMNQALEEQGHALSKEQIQALDDFGDAMARTAHTIKNTFIGAMADALIAVRNLFNETNSIANNPNVSFTRPKTVNEATIGGPAARKAINEALVARGLKPLPEEPIKNTEQATAKTKDLTKATDDLDRSLQKVEKQSIQTTRILKDSFGDALESAMFDFRNFGNAAGSILEGLARNLARRKIIDPLSEGVGGFFDDLLPSFGGFFADGGRPPVGIPSIVGENGPEIFVPNSAGTIVPNRAIGGQTVIVQQTINLSPGLAETVNAAILNAAPAIAAAAQAGVFAELQRGGSGARIAGLRS